MQDVAYSSPRGDSNVFMLIFGWGMFIYAAMVALYFLGNALWVLTTRPARPRGTVGQRPVHQSAAGVFRNGGQAPEVLVFGGQLVFGRRPRAAAP